MKVLYLQEEEVLAGQRDEVRKALGRLEEVKVAFGSTPAEACSHADAEIVIAPTLPWLPEALSRLPDVRWIHFLGAGVDRVWEMPLEHARFVMSKSSGVHAPAISEYVLGTVLYVLKSFGTFQRQQRRREWRRLWLQECAGKTLGILGVGSIGKLLAERATALGMRVVGTVSQARPIPFVEEVYGPGDLRLVLRQSDFLVLLLPLTAVTRGLIDEDAFESMKGTAWLVNAARGEIVSNRALLDALQSNRIGGAVLDVFEEEPLPPSSPLWNFENVLITPHVAGTTQHYVARALDVFMDNYREFSATGQLVTPVDQQKMY